MDNKEPSINAWTTEDSVVLSFLWNFQLTVNMEVDSEGTKTLHVTLKEGAAKELLIVLNGLYGQEDWEVFSRLTKEQYQFLASCAKKEEMTIEDFLRQLIQAEIDRAA